MRSLCRRAAHASKADTSLALQDLVILAHVVNLPRERWQSVDGTAIMAPLPAGIYGHFRPQLHRFVLAQYHQVQTTVAGLVTFLCSLGLLIVRRRLVRLLIREGFLTEACDARAGLSTAAWIVADDTVARRAASNGSCTQVGNAQFAWFGRTAARSCLNFLELLGAGFAEALAYMRERVLAAQAISETWNTQLDALGITALKISTATEGAPLTATTFAGITER